MTFSAWIMNKKRSWTKQCLKFAKLFLFFHLLAYIAAISSALKKS